MLASRLSTRHSLLTRRISTGHQVLALTVLGAGLRIPGIDQGIWHDGITTILLVKMPLGQMLSALPHQEASPPVYYLLLWGWDHVFGFGVVASRAFGVLISIPLIPVMYSIAVRLTRSHWTGMIAAACTASSPFLVWYAQEIRPYELLALLTAISFLAFLRIIMQTPERRDIVIWTVASVLALGTHFYAVFTIIPQAVWLLIQYRRRVDVLVAANLLALCGLALIPMLESEASGLGFYYITNVPRSMRLAQIVPQFLIGVSSPASTALSLICLFIALAAILVLALRGTRSERHAGIIMALFAFGGFALVMMAERFLRDSLLTRNVIGLWVPAALLVAIGLGSSRTRIAGTTLAVTLNGIGVAVVLAVALTPSLQRIDWIGVAQLIRSPPQATPSNNGRRLVVLENWRVLSPLVYYMPSLHKFDLPAKGNALTNVTEIDLVRQLQSAPTGTPFCWWGTPCVPFSVPRPYPNRIPGFRVIADRQVQEFVVVRLRSVGHPRDVTVRSLGAATEGLPLSGNSYFSVPSLTS